MMNIQFLFLLLIISPVIHFPVLTQTDDFKLLFNEKDLTGWVNVNCAPETWSVREGMIICTGIPTGVLRTERMYENYILELEWRHLHKGGNAGLFVHSDALTSRGQPFTRSIECQIMDGNEGDMFAIHGARLTPDNADPFERVGWMRSFPKEERTNPAGEWNHYRVVSRNGMLTLAVNGKVVTRGFYVNPRKGYICLESEGSEVHFRNIRIRELPGTNPPPELTAKENEGYVALYNGLDLRGWTADNTTSWKADNWRLTCDEGKDRQEIFSVKQYTDFRLIADWRLRGEPVAREVPVILNNGKQAVDDTGDKLSVPIRDAGKALLLIRGKDGPAVEITCWPIGSGSILDGEGNRMALPVFGYDNPPGEWNRFEISMSDNRIDIRLNGKEVIKNYHLDSPGQKGKIGLQYEGYPVEFANIYMLEL